MAFTHRLTVRFDDVDYAQIVYFPRLFTFCHWAFEDFFAAETDHSYAEWLKEKRVGFPIVHSSADFKHPLRFGDACRVVMETTKLGQKSLTNRYRLYLGDSQKLCAEVEMVHVATHLDRFKSVDIPANVREALLNHLAGYTSP